MKRDKNSPIDEFLFDQFNKQNNDSAEKIEEEIYNIKSKGTPTDVEEKVPQNVTTNLTKTRTKRNKNHLSFKKSKKSKRNKNQNKKKNNICKSEISKKLSENDISIEEVTLDTPQAKHEISDTEKQKSIKLFLEDKKIEEREKDNSIKIINLKGDKNNQNEIKPISKNENEINIIPELKGEENKNIPKDNVDMSEQKKNGNNSNLNNINDMSISDQGENLNNNNQIIENSMSLSEPEQNDNENFQNSHLINDINNINNELNEVNLNDINYSETFYPNGDGEEILENNTNALVYANNEPNSNINELLQNSDDTFYVTDSIEVNNNNVFYNEYEENITNLSDMLNNDVNINQEDNGDILNESQIVDINVNVAGCSWKKGK